MTYVIERTFGVVLVLLLMPACAHVGAHATSEPPFETVSEQFADIRILRYQIPDFDKLSLQQKTLAYYLSRAALAGRDILWDQNYKHNLTIRRTIEQIYKHYQGDRNNTDFENFLVYAKRVWFSNGIHHHYSNDKILPAFSQMYFASLVTRSTGAQFPTNKGEALGDFVSRLSPILFDPNLAPKKVCQDSSIDLVTCSAVNFYEGVNQSEVEAYFKTIQDPADATPISCHGTFHQGLLY